MKLVLVEAPAEPAQTDDPANPAPAHAPATSGLAGDDPADEQAATPQPVG